MSTALDGNYPRPQSVDLESQSDEDLLLAYRDSEDRAAFETLVHRYERELFNYLRRYLGNASLAEDAFQGTFLQLHLKCNQFAEGARLKPWLYTIATHQAIDVLRKNKRHQMTSLDRPHGTKDEQAASSLLNVLEGDEDGPVRELQAAERREWVRTAVAELPEHLRAAVVLAYNQGMKYRDIADVLQIPVGTVKSRLHTAVQKLHDAWQQSDFAGAE